MTIDIKYEKKMAIVWLALAVLNLVCTIVNLISKDWLDFILFLDITMLCINLCLKHRQVLTLSAKKRSSKLLQAFHRIVEVQNLHLYLTNKHNKQYGRKENCYPIR